MYVGQLKPTACSETMSEGKYFKINIVKIKHSFIMLEATSVPLGNVDEFGDCQDEGIPMQRLVHSSSLNLQLSLNYLYGPILS